MLRVRVSRMYLQVGRLIGSGEATFTTDCGNTHRIEGVIMQDKPFEFVMKGVNGAITVSHSPMTTLGFQVINYWPEGTREPAVITVYKEVGFSSSKSGKCPVCLKSAVRKQKFFQTINPFNRNADDTLKTAAQIMAQLCEERDTWKAEPTLHVKCETKK